MLNKIIENLELYYFCIESILQHKNMLTFKFPFVVKALPQTVQAKGFSPV